MITMQRARWRRRAAAAAASVAIGLGLVGAVAGPASAEDGTAEYKGFYQGFGSPESVSGYWNGSDDLDSVQAGLFILDVADQDEDSLAYCVQRNEGNDTDATYEEQPFDNIHNVEKVGLILANYFPLGTGPEGFELENDGSDLDKKFMAAATQSAIWHYTDGFDLWTGAGNHNHPKVVGYYETILAAAESGTLEGLGGSTVTLTIEGPDDVEAIPGELVGPYVVSTTAATVELTTTGGLTIHNEDGTPFEGAASDGTEVWLKATEAGTGTLSGVASGLQSGGRVFGGTGIQDLAFAVVTPVEVPASVDLEVGPTPTTAPPSSTTTKVGTTTTESTVPETTVTAPTTTVPGTPQASGGLPVTGTQTMLLVAAALVLLIVGGAFGLAAKRRADGGTT
jgi:TQXA domain-containing protein/LPXTG-motif cell wall-anchored protein